MVLLLGTERFGAPGPAVRQRLDEESGLERFEDLARRVLHTSSWDELLA